MNRWWNAIYSGQTEDIRRLANQTPELIHENQYLQRSSLFVSCRYGNTQAVKLLLDLGADVNTKDDCDVTALAKAAMNNSVDCVHLLLNNHADYSISDVNGDNPMFAAVSMDAVESVIILASFCPSLVNSRNLVTTETCLMRAADVGSVNSLGQLLNYGADLDSRNERGQSALLIASKNGNLECMKALLNAGSRVSEVDNDGASVVHWATIAGHAHILQYLIDNTDSVELNIDRTDSNGDSALCNAVRSKSSSCMRVLLDAGAQLGKSVECAARLCHWEMFEELLAREAESVND